MNAELISKNIYLVPGLGADGRLFSRIQWPASYNITALNWIEPLENESIESYSKRLTVQMDISRPFIIIGVSLGGIMSIEIAKHVPAEKIIIISSIKHKNEKPFYFSAGHLFKNIVLVSWKHRNWLRLIVRIFFGAMSLKEFDLFRDMLQKVGSKQIKWSQNAILNWNNTKIFENLVHIQGTADLVFPVMFIKNYISVKNGNHYMVVNKAKEISAILKEVLKFA